ncbi:hypothetical protein ILP92_11015 [Maribius pontilimi]|uniref:Uncharacterized protein n=1 Tax=Palleronia pontilimi TaxID=1964209 RepID=A0A934MA61_9RHOB|nr:hypothetical protein [Palleronia pontilimi]MBJ3763277.1 hypothetical protein [Palleronia pontilimi]
MMQMIFNAGLKRRIDSDTQLSGGTDRSRKVERREIETLLAAELSALPPLAA